MPSASTTGRVGKGPRLAARMARGNEQQRRRRRGNRRPPHRAAAPGRGKSRRKPSRQAAPRRSAMPGRIDLALHLLRQSHRLLAIEPAEGDFRMRFDDAPAQLGPRPISSASISRILGKCRKPGSRRRAADPRSPAPPSLALRCASYQASTVVKSLVVGIDRGARRDREDAGLALRRAADAPAASGPRPPLREISGRPIGMSTAMTASSGRLSTSAAKVGKIATDGCAARRQHHRDPAGLAAVDADDRAAAGSSALKRAGPCPDA